MNSAPSDLKSIFGQAADIAAPADRAAYLDDACGDDAALRSEVEALLNAAEKAGSFMGGPAIAVGDTEMFPAIAERPGTVIGPYKLLQQIGEGGMGVVFMAEQSEPIHRTVALKIIKPGMDTRQIIGRFEAERQALAMMDHPNIARVLDAGETETGRPYFVMELVKGAPITQYCDEHRLNIAERLELFVQVCQAVQHAHQKGIIHRDLKPSNVLVAEYDDNPVPKVIDFGVAKATAQKLTERTMFTEFGQLVGTFEYMSPEQTKLNQLDVDTRSDIYSLGVLLYELLAGTTPLEKGRVRSASFDEILHIISEEDPPRLSTRLSSSQTLAALASNRGLEPDKLSHAMRGELDWIVMKCLEKDRNRRYPTANALALDIQRYLNDEPIEARRPTRSYRLKKFIHRNMAGMLVGASIAAALLAAVVILLVSNARIRKEVNIRDLALKEKDAALETAQEAVDRMLTQVASERFSDMPLSHPLRIALLEDALTFYERLAGQMGADPTLRHRVASLLHTHAGLLREVGNYDRAEGVLRQSSDLLQSLEDTDPNPPTVLEERARVEFDLAFTLHQGHEPTLLTDSVAQKQYRRSLELFGELDRQWPGRCEPPVLGHRMLAKVALHQGDHKEALRLWREGLKLGTNYLNQQPRSLNVCIEIGWTCVHLSDALSSESPEPAAENGAVLTQGIEVVGKALADQPQSTRAADVNASLQIRMAALICRQGRIDEALPIFEQAVAGMELLCEGSPWTADYWNTLRWFHQEIVVNLRAAGHDKAVAEALEQFQKWLDRVEPQMADDPDLREQMHVSQGWLNNLLVSNYGEAQSVNESEPTVQKEPLAEDNDPTSTPTSEK